MVGIKNKVLGCESVDLTKSGGGEFLNFNDGTDSLGFHMVGATPEGSVTANVGSLAVDKVTGRLWRKQSGTGNTGWVASGYELLLSTTTAATPASVVFDFSTYSPYYSNFIYYFNGQGGSTNSYPTFSLYNDGGSSPLTVEYSRNLGGTGSDAQASAIFVDANNVSGTAKRGWMVIDNTQDGSVYGGSFRGILINNTNIGCFWGSVTALGLNAVSMQNAAGTLTNGIVHYLYGRR